MDWSICPEDFEWDGSLRDIYILETSSDDWNRFISLLRMGTVPYRFTVDGDDVAMPETFQEIFQMWLERSLFLTIYPGSMNIIVHFYTEEEIEMDFDAADFMDFNVGDFSVDKVEALSAFLAQFGRTLGKTVAVTPESQQERWIWQFAPEVDRWFHRSELRSIA